MPDITKLTKIDDLRVIWKHEAKDFSKWLSMEDNLSMLGDEIGIELSLLQTEAPVGLFSVDLLAEEENTGKKVIIENQLDATNHDHLGKIITYASGYNAEIIIWIVKSARDEHRQAVDWLNEHTDESINLFLVEIELWKIADSPIAVKFQVVSRPNDWTKTIRGTAGLSDTKTLQGELWEYFNEQAKDTGFIKSFNIRKARPKHWYDLTIGNSEAHLALTVDTMNKVIRCELYIPDNKDLYLKLEGQKAQIESDLGYSAEWMELPQKKGSRIRVEYKVDIKKKETWDASCKWFREKAIEFKKTFSNYLL